MQDNKLKTKQRNASKKYYHKNAIKIKEKRKQKWLNEQKEKAIIFKKKIQEKIANGEEI
jgi:hypothetical protein